MKRIIFAGMFLFIYTSFISLNAQWAITYGGSGYDRSRSFQQTSDGGYIVVGETNSFEYGDYEIWILKLNSSGDIEWQKTYGADFHLNSVSFIQQTSDGGYIVAGYTGIRAVVRSDYWILKLNSSGDIEWHRTYDADNYDYVWSIQQIRDGGYIVVGETSSFEYGDYDIWILKLNSSGDIEWQKTYGGSEEEEASSIYQTDDGGYIIAGNTNSFGAGGSDIWVLKLSTAGDIEWQKTYGGSNSDYAHSIQETSDGGYIAAGNISGDIWISKISSVGDFEWERTYEGTGWGSVNSFHKTSDGGYIAAGNISGDIWISKISSAGDIEWQKTYGEREWDVVHSFQQTSDGGYIVAGETGYFAVEWNDDIWILKLSSAGDIEWQKTYGGNYSMDFANFIQQTSDEGYIFTGDTYSWGAGESDIWVLKLSPNGDINPRCAFIKSSNAEVSDINIIPADTDIIAEDTDIIPADTGIIPVDTDILFQDSDANVYKLCVSDTCTLILSASSGGTTSPKPGIYTYDTGTEVTLNAVPSAGYDFLDFRGNVQVSVRQITITMDGDKTISANFYKLPPPWPGGDLEEWGGGDWDIGPSCLIATAAYGSPLHPYVDTLRDFRDKYLISSKFGRKFVDLYYKYSPSLANCIAKHKILKLNTRISLLPLVAFSYSMVHFGPLSTMVMIVFIFVLPIFLILFFRRKFRRMRALSVKALVPFDIKDADRGIAEVEDSRKKLAGLKGP